MSRVGIAIKTRNRKDVFKKSFEEHLKYLPKNAFVAIVDDGSDSDYAEDAYWKLTNLGIPAVYYQHQESQGIIAADNRCLELLMEKEDIKHFFLWDDDAYPKEKGWERPYIKSPEPHLMYQFEHYATRPLGDIVKLHEDFQHVAYSGARGVMLYFDRSVIEQVGGFDWIFQRGMYEHGDLSNRIYNRGLTTWRFADIVDSSDFIHSMDEHEEVTRSVSQEDREQQVIRNSRIYHERMKNDYDGYAPRTKPRNVVMTCLLTSNPDPQRGVKWIPKFESIQKWYESIDVRSKVLFADEFQGILTPSDLEVVEVLPSEKNVYFARWQHVYNYLRKNLDIEFCWATDGSDVEMWNSPWEEMVPGTLYLGYEPQTLRNEWLHTYHESLKFKDTAGKFPHKSLVNPGVVGGDRETVMKFAHKMMQYHDDMLSDIFWQRGPRNPDIGDMAAVQAVSLDFNVMANPQVVTVFKGYQERIDNDFSWWRHK